MPENPVVLIHGYSDKGASFQKWADILKRKGFRTHICTYQSLTNEVTVKDLAEGLNRALRTCAGLEQDQPFDAIVHSTGMLVLRSWLTTYPKRRDRLKRLIGLAPATFGSPVARMGRSWLGAIVKGNKDEGPDFLEAGDKILDALELASPFTWDLAHKDLFCEPDFYGPENSTPYVFVFCGTDMYKGFRKFVNSPGTDGTVRIAGAALNARKFRIDLSRARDGSQRGDDRISISAKKSIDLPLWPMEGLTHGSILSDPSSELQELVLGALQVNRESKPTNGEPDDSYESWYNRAREITDETRQNTPKWQQFIVHAIDERGDPITDYQFEIFSKTTGETLDLQLDPDIYKYDTSYRAFHVDVGDLVNMDDLLSVKIIAKSGSELVDYRGEGGERGKGNQEGLWDAVVDITVSTVDGQRFFQPLTTTLIELVLNRDPLPFTSDRVKLCYFGAWESAGD